MASLDDNDFDFSISSKISIENSSPAGEIFSGGKLLPLSSIRPLIATSANIALQQHRQNDLENIDDRMSKINNNLEDTQSIKKLSVAASTGRSRSVGAWDGASRPMIGSICPFPRSKSTSSYLNQNQNCKERWGKRNLQRSRPNNNCYYYSGSCRESSYGNGVRINPVINVHAHFIPRGGSGRSKNNCNGGNSFFAHLLCFCGDKSKKEL